MKNAYRSRRLALQALCCLDVQGEKALAMALDFIRDGNESLEFIEKAEFMTKGAMCAIPRCDELIKDKSRKWSLNRIALVDRNILRLAVWELMSDHAPPKVVIDQAVRLAKEFSTEHSGGFVNGVLDAICREFAGPEDADFTKVSEPDSDQNPPETKAAGASEESGDIES